MNPLGNWKGRSQRLLPRLSFLAAAAVVPLVGCDRFERILEVEDPTVALPGTIQNPLALPAVQASVIGDFAVAYGGIPGGGSTLEGQVLISGLLGDELYSPDSFPTRIEVDQRMTEFDNATMQDAFRRLSRARVTAERATGLFEQFGPNTAGHAESLSFAGYSYILFGENYCSGVPFSTLPESGPIEFGAPLPTAEIFNRALERFDAGLAAANAVLATAQALPAAPAATRTAAIAAAERQQNLARIGRGRALLNLNRRAEAAAAVAAVPTAYAYRLERSTNSTRENNGVWDGINNARRYGVSDLEGGNGLPYRTANDPRVRWDRAASGAASFGFDQSTPLFRQQKYPNRDSPVDLALGTEARLIQAEAALPGDVASLVTNLNAVRATFTGTNAVPALVLANVQAMTPRAREDLLFQERAFTMWLTSHRLGDMRRLIRQYGRGSETVFPTGPFFKGGPYGNHVSMPVPFDELNNPQFVRCDPTQA
jgi:hypothetical protein